MYERDSVYSNEPVSPINSNFYQQPVANQALHERTLSGPEAISPISSKEELHRNDSSGSLVSPIESTFSSSARSPLGDSGKQSQIPKRLPTAIGKDSTERNLIKKRWSHKTTKDGETRWDAYSGEPTDGQKGQQSAFRSGGQPEEQPYPQLKERTRQILAGLKDRESVKKSSWAKSPPPVDDPLDSPTQRPAWKGASGRTTLVEPVKNTPGARTKPLLLLQRKKPERETQSPTPEETTEPPQRPANMGAISSTSLATIRSVASEESIKPVAPLKGRNTPRVLSPTAAEAPKALDSPFQSPGPAPRNMPVYDDVPSPAPSTIRDYAGDSPTLGSVHSFEVERQPVGTESRLQREAETSSSWNTYTSTHVDDYQGAPSSPISREQFTSSPVPMADSGIASAPIMLRKRIAANNSGRNYDNYNSVSPFAGVGVRKSSSSILRKAVGADKPRAASLTSTMSASKSLPPTPVEATAADKAASLEARLSDLSQRKRNTNKIINELRESLKKNAIVFDARKRNEVDKMIINLTLELQDISNEEHETNLKLYRVQKRRDKDEFYEQPTGLWIKRVTT